ncbi:MAG TPA: tetratricopeptide repeat protein [Sedimentisphaerales bacterium]|nr:tetratricopeptide repeat protein [Sedimentisphaerales bacterium]
MYLSSAGLSVLVVTSAYFLLTLRARGVGVRGKPVRGFFQAEYARWLVGVLVVVVAAALTWRTVRRNEDYRSGVSIWQKVVEAVPCNPRGHDNLGVELQAQDRFEEAIFHHRRALEIKPDNVTAHTNLGAALKSQGKLEEAVAHHRQSLRLKPSYVNALVNLGVALSAQGKLNEAVGYYRRALEIKPDCAAAYTNLGNVLQSQGKLDEAISLYRHALKANPGSAEVYNNLGTALQSRGDFDEAISFYRKAVKIKPDYANAYTNLGHAFQSQGKFDAAMGSYLEALRIKPEWPATLNGMAWLLATRPGGSASELQEAVRLAERACELTEYQNAAIVDTLAAAYAAAGRFEEAVKAAESALGSASKADELAEQIRERLELYRQKKPYREPVPTQGSTMP